MHGRVKNLLEEIERVKPAETSVSDQIVLDIYRRAEKIAQKVIVSRGIKAGDRTELLDNILTSRLWGFPVMFFLLAAAFWVTLAGANYPSQMLSEFLFWAGARLAHLGHLAGVPERAVSFLVDGVYNCMAWVIAVMLPPMAIFFPCFSFLEETGYLPRIAFNLDRIFKAAGAHGKQALTTCMGFGCNAAGVAACRIIESPRERKIAMLTNCFIPCNGRFPTLIALSSLLFYGTGSHIRAAAAVTAAVLVGIAVSLAVSWLLSRTILKGIPSSFMVELPPYRWPPVGRVLVRSFLDRTVFVLGRAATVAAVAGGVIWFLANSGTGQAGLLAQAAAHLDAPAKLLGLDGYILLAFLLGLPANEIVLPIALMGYLSASTMVEPGSLDQLHDLLFGEHGWTAVTVTCTILFSLLHYPCSTTLWTIWREGQGIKWALLGALIPFTVACAACFLTSHAAAFLGI